MDGAQASARSCPLDGLPDHDRPLALLLRRARQADLEGSTGAIAALLLAILLMPTVINRTQARGQRA
jgi:hypothetical protein